MFEKFGEFNSAEDINLAAEGFKREGDIESLKEMLKENGLEPDMADMYMNDLIPFVTEPVSAAIGKLDVEAKALDCKELMLDWVEYIKTQCFEDVVMAKAVRSGEKHLSGALGELLKYSFDNRIKVNDEIIKAAGIKASRVDFGIAGMAKAKEILKKYYKGGE